MRHVIACPRLAQGVRDGASNRPKYSGKPIRGIFITKPSGGGAQLGLSIIVEIATQRHRGR
jgi:hypothetical protein